MNLFRKLFGRKAKNDVDVNAVADKLNSKDPLDVMSRINNPGWKSEEQKDLVKASDFPLAQIDIEEEGGVIEGRAEDSAVSDASCGNVLGGDPQSAYSVAPALSGWYASQGFIGYQMCAILAQQWLVDKACSQSVEDAVRNGWTYKPDSGNSFSQEEKTLIDDADIEMGLKTNLMEYGRFANVFGIRVMIFEVDSDDPNYYTKPFNIDGIQKGSYKGMSQVDPYWMTPMLTNQSMSNPASIGFYEPDYWIINGIRYHKSHLRIARGPQPADILKPTYIFGGISLVQRIYERVYAAERTANEAPLLAMNKRTTAIHVDLDKVAANEASFVERLLMWVKYRDNHGVKVLGKEETMEQFDTSLTDFDSVIMNQYQIVAATAKTPATKILGTSPKGFNATGEFETVSYHEELESIQERWLTPALNFHYLILSKSLGLESGIKASWEPVDSMSSEKQADINSKKVADAVSMISAGMISPDEGREKLAQDRDSGWNNLALQDDADQSMGASPDNIAALQKAGAAQTRAGAAQIEAKSGVRTNDDGVSGDSMDESESDSASLSPDLIKKLAAMRSGLENLVENHETPSDDASFKGGIEPQRTVKPSVEPIKRDVAGINSVVKSMPEEKLPKMKIAGMIAVIENPRGTIRQGNSISGPWQIKMPHHYGYIKGTKGSDGDEVDCFIGPNPKSPLVFIVNQNDEYTDEFDEHKVMLGFDSEAEAKEGYLSAFGDDWKGFSSIVEISMSEFKQWVSSSSEEQPLDAPYLASHNTDGPRQN